MLSSLNGTRFRPSLDLGVAGALGPEVPARQRRPAETNVCHLIWCAGVVGRSDLESLLGSNDPRDWVAITEMLLGPPPPGFLFAPKHKAQVGPIFLQILLGLDKLFDLQEQSSKHLHYIISTIKFVENFYPRLMDNCDDCHSNS